MGDNESQSVPRTPDEPSPEALRDGMRPGEPYMAADFVEEWDVSRWTIQRRLDELHEDGRIRRKKHANNSVTWWIEVDLDEE